MIFFGDIIRFPMRFAKKNQRQIVGLAGLLGSDPAHSSVCEPDHCIASIAERAFSNPEDNFSNVQIVHEPVTRNKNGVARLQPDLGPDIDSHVRCTQKIRDKVAFGVMQRLAFIKKTGFNRQPGWRMHRCL